MNIHLDDLDSTHATRFTSLLECFGLHDLVRQPTHKKGHKLEIFVTRSDQPVSYFRVDPPLLSDHSLIVSSMEVLAKRPVRNTTVMRPCWRSFDIDVFVAELKRSRLVTDPPSYITELFDCYGATLSELLDRLAPLQLTRIWTRPSAPCFDAECHGIKAVTRRLEKAHRRKPSPHPEAEWRSQRALFQKKSVDYWSSAIDSCR